METQQRTLVRVEAWQEERLGKITASEVWKLMKSGRGKEEYFSQTALSYIHEKIAELHTGEIPEPPMSKAIDWGKEHEAQAAWVLAEKLEEEMDYFGAENPKFCPYNTYSGASPDALTPTHLIEIKCPYTSRTHLENLLAPSGEEVIRWLEKNRYEYYAQMQFGMMCTKREKALFVSYDPRMIQQRHRLSVIECPADEILQEQLSERIQKAAETISNAMRSLEAFLSA